MKIIPAIALACALLGSFSLTASQADLPVKKVEQPLKKIEEANIKVLLAKNVNGALLEVKGPYRVVRKDKIEVLSSGVLGKRFVVHAIKEGIRWGEEYPSIYQIRIEPAAESTIMYVDGMQYKGTISVYHTKEGGVTVVNEVTLEDYLKSTLATQYQSTLAKEALSALVIAARTLAYERIEKNANSKMPWDISAKEANYFGHGVTLKKNGVDEAIDVTKHIVITGAKGNAPLENFSLTKEEAIAYAEKGLDAKQIIRACCPQGDLGVIKDGQHIVKR
jgi:stage II sporulation protein D